jgi:ribosomal protein L11 methyltransferase
VDGRVTGGGEDARKRRLAAALRENLRRRKAQSRGRATGDGGGASPETGADASGSTEAVAAVPALPAAGAGSGVSGVVACAGENTAIFAADGLGVAPPSGDDPAASDSEPDDTTWRVRLVAAELEAERIAALIERAVEADGWPVTRYELPPAAATGLATGPTATVRAATTGSATERADAGPPTAQSTTAALPIIGPAAPATLAPAVAGATTGGSEPGGAKTDRASAAGRASAERSTAVEAGAGAPAFAARLLRDEEWPWAVEVLVFGGSAAQARSRILDAVGGDGFGSLITVEPLEAEDWVAKSLEGLPPVREGRFVVRGRHARGGEPAGIVAIDIDAGLAFGTGHHATTVGCLAAIERSLARRRPRRPLDLGTGTGVLAIAIARLAKVAVVASDIDPVAVRVAAGNARANGVGPWVRPFVATGMADRRLAVGCFDLVAANILARPLERLAPAIGRALAPRATVILSGLRVPDGRRVEAAYRRQGLVLTRRDARDGWLTLTFQRG